jgi:hypothetical protein
MKTSPTHEILFENLAALGYPPENKSVKLISIYPDTRYGSTKFAYCALSKDLYLFAFDAFKSSAYPSPTFMGIYAAVDLPADAEYRVLKRDWVHFILKNRQRVGSVDINKKITLLSSTWIPDRELGEHTVDQFLKLHDSTRKLYTLLVRNDYLPQIEEFKGKKILGIETDNWLYEKGALAHFIELGSKLVLDVKQHSY